MNSTSEIYIFITFYKFYATVYSEIPISETIIVGKVPQTAIDLGIDNAGFRLKAIEGN